MIVQLAELARLVGGSVQGDAALAISGAATLENASPSEITFIDSVEKLSRLTRSHAAAVVCPEGVAPTQDSSIQCSLIKVANVQEAFAMIVKHFHPPRQRHYNGFSPASSVSATARIGENVTIYPGAFIDDDVEIGDNTVIHSGVRIMAGCKIAENVTIFPNVVMYEDTIVGARSIIHAGVILGAYGFGYKMQNGSFALSQQLGYVQLGTDVEIGANATIDRGTYGATYIGDGTKIDNLVMIAHNCRIGKHNMICSQVGIAGSTTTGDYVTMAGQVGVRDHVHIGTGAKLGAMAGVSCDVPDNAHMLGAPAIPEREQKLQFAALSKLPEMRKDVKLLKHQMEVLLANATIFDKNEGENKGKAA